mmetsp:Transcript_34168/g.59706  ORF Transcript_34168/g.59706 Transcript_34168/m.59706 type:complete len:378 (+) Transcript_34168:4506-5639(+)
MLENSLTPYFLLSSLLLLDMYAFEFHDKPLVLTWILFTVAPGLDHIVPLNQHNPTKEEQKILKKEMKWRVPPILFCLIDWFYFFWGFNKLASGTLSTGHTIAMIFSIGNGGGLSFTTSHEIFHKKDLFSRIFGTLNLTKTFYMQFFIQHNTVHHKYVATPLDPATAKFGQTFPQFLVQSVKGTFFQSWEYEVKRLGTAWTVKNRHFWFLGAELALTMLIYWLYSWYGVAVLFIQAVISIQLLEAVNYVEHYGLERKEISPGVYEPVTIKHSWNAAHTVSNYLFLKLQRHSDHHENAYKPYQTLCSYKVSPNLPCGYGICILASNFPSLWFAMINPLAMQANLNGNVKKEDLEKSEYVLKAVAMLQSVVLTALFIIFV